MPWCDGGIVEQTEHYGISVYSRSDATLNPAVRDAVHGPPGKNKEALAELAETGNVAREPGARDTRVLLRRGASSLSRDVFDRRLCGHLLVRLRMSAWRTKLTLAMIHVTCRAMPVLWGLLWRSGKRLRQMKSPARSL